MKYFLTLIIGVFGLLIADSSLAADQTIYVNGYGRSSGYCQASFFNLCKNDLERRAEQDGQMDADRECRFQGGYIEYNYSCSTFCNPFYIPPSSQGDWVNCDSNCHLPCRIQDDSQ